MRPQRPSQRPSQQGAVLVTGLVILVVMTILGLTAMQTTVLEEKMVGNVRDRSVAFEAAEAGLQAGLSYLEGKTNPVHAGSATGVWAGCTINDAACTDTADETWLGEQAGIDYDGAAWGGTTLPGLHDQPMVAIEERYVPPLDFEAAARGEGIHFYSVSSLGYGGSSATRVLLQATIGKVYAW